MTADILMDWVCRNASDIRNKARLGGTIEKWLQFQLADDLARRGMNSAVEIPFPGSGSGRRPRTAVR